MAIKSLDELRKLRASLQDRIVLREKGEIEDSKLIEVLVGMGTSGIAAGARETFSAIHKIVSDKKLSNVKVITVGCLGYMDSEPTVQVNIPGKEPVIFGKITEDKVNELVEKVIIKGELLEEDYLIKSFNKAVV